MSIKHLIQILITLLIILIIGVVYYEYLSTSKKIVKEDDVQNIISKEKLNQLETKINELEIKNNELRNKINENKNVSDDSLQKIVDNKSSLISQSEVADEISQNKKTELNASISKSKKNKLKKNDVKNLVKDIEYTSVDEKGNKFYLLATSGKSNAIDNNILDLENVRGKILSDTRDTIYIVSDFGQYNSLNLNSKFYENVIIDYQDKKITCINFDINMETNMAIAYNNVVITDPKSIMKAGIVEFDLKTKDIEIKPETKTEEVKIVTN